MMFCPISKNLKTSKEERVIIMVRREHYGLVILLKYILLLKLTLVRGFKRDINIIQTLTVKDRKALALFNGQQKKAGGQALLQPT